MSTPAHDAPRTLSIIVVCYQAAATIERCLAALVPQRSDVVEIVVVDSGTDATADLVERRFPEVRLVRSATRLAPGAARNAGIAAARGELIGFVDRTASQHRTGPSACSRRTASRRL